MPTNARTTHCVGQHAVNYSPAGKAHIAYTPVISDGITNGSKPMRYSLVSRDYIADCLEIMHEG
jgi:dihydroxyacid dehydratase/phosphogluconate dehydratase